MTPPARSLPQATESVCPVCLRRIPAEYVLDPAEEGIPSVLLRKECPEHGVFSVPVWRGMPDFRSWVRDKTPSHPRHPFVERERGCPFDCGLCPDHAQHTCTGLIEVTGRCNLRCPVCYASAGEQVAPEPSLERIAFQMDRLRQASGACNVQLSGGEPTVRDDLPEIIRMAKARGFALIQCNTNGLRLGTEPGYAASLREAGLDSVYLQCDAADDAAHEILRGRRCLPDVIGARPGKAMIVEDEEEILKDFVQMNAQQKKDAAASFAAYAAEHVSTDKNMRASKEYRSLLVKVLTRRAWEEIGGRAE